MSWGNFRSIKDLLPTSLDALKESYKCDLVWGLPYLDKELRSIGRTETVMVAAEPGSGKTTFMEDLIWANAKKGKKIVTFFLENDETTLLFRFTWKEICVTLGKAGLMKPEYDYRGFIFGAYDEIRDLAAKTMTEVAERLKDHVVVFGKVGPVTHEGIASMFSEAMVAQQADLVIFDYIQHLDSTFKQSENIELARAIREIRRQVLLHRVPCVVVSQQNMASLKEDSVTLGALHGSGELAKAPDIVLFISSYGKLHDYENNRFATLFRVAKGRNGGSKFKAGLHYYNSQLWAYEPEFQTFSIVKGLTEMRPSGTIDGKPVMVERRVDGGLKPDVPQV